MDNDAIKKVIEAGFPEDHVEFTGDGYQFQTLVVSDKFTGLNTVKRHQMVYACLGDLISSGQLHALTIKALTKEEWERTNG